MRRTIAVVVTLDTKGREADFVRAEIESHGCSALLVDIGVVGEPTAKPGITREEIAAAGGRPLSELLENPIRQEASPIMVRGAAKLLLERLSNGQLDGVLSLGGTQGTTSGTAIMQTLPYGFPKVMVSTVAAGDCSSFVGIKDITMMFSVSDILGLNPLTRKILSNAAGAVCGMSASRVELGATDEGRPLLAMTNLGVLTEGATRALERFKARGYEVIVFHAVGSGGSALEQMMKDGLVGGVFDYALGEISDELFDGLRAATPERLTVAGSLGLPQVVCPGGTEHLGILVPADTVPDRWSDHKYVFHSPIILAPRLNPDEFVLVAEEMAKRLAASSGPATVMFPSEGTSRYSVPGGPLRDPEGDAAFLEALRQNLPPNAELLVRDCGAEDPAFVDEAVDRLLELVEGTQ